MSLCSRRAPAMRAAAARTVTAARAVAVIDGGGGSIDVTGTARTTVGVSEQALYSRRAPLSRHELSGTTLTLSSTCPSQVICGVSSTVTVPRGVALRVFGGAGAITLTSLSGPVTARAEAGLITAVDLRGASANLTSSAGGIVAPFAVAPGASCCYLDYAKIADRCLQRSVQKDPPSRRTADGGQRGSPGLAALRFRTIANERRMTRSSYDYVMRLRLTAYQCRSRSGVCGLGQGTG